jgi:hypothetical protein
MEKQEATTPDKDTFKRMVALKEWICQEYQFPQMTTLTDADYLKIAAMVVMIDKLDDISISIDSK